MAKIGTITVKFENIIWRYVNLIQLVKAASSERNTKAVISEARARKNGMS